MSDSIEHNGIIDQIQGDTIHVRIIQQSACAGCHAKSICSASDNKAKIIEIADSSGKYREGEKVIICGKSSLGLQAVFLAFVVPLIIIISTIIIGLTLLGWSESLSGLTGLILLTPYYLGLYITRDKLKKRFIFTLKKHIQ